MSITSVEMLEWETIDPSQNPALQQYRLVDSLAVRHQVEELRDRINITELKDGIAIETTSYVGRVKVDNLMITVQPKIKSSTIVDLLKYGFGLRNLKSFDISEHITAASVFQDLLIFQLLSESKDLINRSLYRQYRRESDDLSSPRGMIDIQRYSRTGIMIDGTMPCIHFPRTTNTLFNQVLLSGLQLSAQLTDDLELRASTRRLASLLEESVAPIRLDAKGVKSAIRAITRLTKAYEPALLLIALLMEGRGISLVDEDSESTNVPGFLFDMNHLWEAVLSRFLKENLTEYDVRDQYHLRDLIRYAPDFNPKGRASPNPRPDFVIFHSGEVVTMADAKYRDIWTNGLPSSMLYQLSIYALSQGLNGTAVILYPTVDPLASIEVLKLSNPVKGGQQATIVLQPINVLTLGTLVYAGGVEGKRQREEYAKRCVLPMRETQLY